MAGEEAPARATPLDLLHDWAVRDSFETFRESMARAMLFPEKADLRRWACARARDRFGAGGLYAEFGVWRGHGVNLFARVLQETGVPVWGFDSFEGLEEDWTGHPRGGRRGRFSTGGAAPEVRANVRLVQGMVQDTVPGWLAAHQGPVAFAHLDLDTYTPTRFVLDALRPRLVAGSVLVFDELYGYPGWRAHEYRALTEALGAEGYDFVAFSEQAVALEIAALR